MKLIACCIATAAVTFVATAATVVSILRGLQEMGYLDASGRL